MNETNLSTWTVDSSKERSFLCPTNSHDTYHTLQIPIGNKSPSQSPPKTRTHRPSASYHSSIEEEINTNPLLLHNARQPPLETSLQNGESLSKTEDNELNEAQHQHIKQQQTMTSLTTYTETYIHPSDRIEYASIDDAKDEEIADMDPDSDTMSTKQPLIHQTLNDTMDYTHKLMATIQQMEEQNHLKYKLRKYTLKIKKLERQLMDEKAMNETKVALLDKVTTELTQTNVEIERMEREKRALNESLKQLENVEQQKRLLEMKNLQLMQQHKLKDLEMERLSKEMMEKNSKLARTLEDRDNISAVSETMREELTNKRAAIIRYKEVQKKLNDKINKYELNDKTQRLSDTLYSAPDATALYLKMNELERDTGLVQQIKDWEAKYNTQSREFMQLKLEHQALKHDSQRLKKEVNGYSEQCRVEMHTKNKLLNELQGIGNKHDSQIKKLKKELMAKNNDIERLKSAMFYMNKFIANQGKDRHLTPAKNIKEDKMNVTSLSFEHDLDLEGTVVDDTESTKSHAVAHKKKKRKRKALKAKSGSNSNAPSPSNGDLLDDITAIVANKKRSKSKSLKQSRGNKSNVRRQFIPTSRNDAHLN
eukprot:262698_1